MEFTFKGHKRYKTILGGVFSLMQRVVLTIFIVYEFYLLYSRKHPITATKYKMLDLDKLDPVTPRDYGFEIAFKLEEKGTD